MMAKVDLAGLPGVLRAEEQLEGRDQECHGFAGACARLGKRFGVRVLPLGSGVGV